MAELNPEIAGTPFDGLSTPSPAPQPCAHVPARDRTARHALSDSARGLLKLQVPVVVTLAHVRQPLGRILKLVPGTVIHFDKSPREPLHLDVAGQPLASGEAVQLDGRLGFRIETIASDPAE